ncbi:MAG: shikimate dehydrogenase, partial [Chloroflexi bacterium RBG_16_48_8]
MDGRSIIAGYEIVSRMVPTFFFVGVTTRNSSIMSVFPRWVEALGRSNVMIEGIDHPLHDDHELYRQTVAQIKFNPLSLGALVTSHKIDILEAAGEMFDFLDPYAKITGEVSCISKRNGSLEGHAKDPITAGLSLDAVLGKDYFARKNAHVMIFGAGGTGAAISLHLINKKDPADRPRRVVVVNRSKPRLDKLRAMVEGLETDIAFEYILNEDQGLNDEIVEDLPEGSIVINATGMGKDRLGSPVSDQGLFPKNGIAWEINYRGELDFWHQAMAQREGRGVIVEDG